VAFDTKLTRRKEELKLCVENRKKGIKMRKNREWKDGKRDLT